MDLREILSISGFGGLFKLISQSRNGLVVEGLEDKKRMNAFSHYKVSSLHDIAIYTDTEEIPLRKVLAKIYEKENGQQAFGGKIDEKQLKAYFETILPDYDRDRVYVSDIKKVISWYNILVRCGFTSFEDAQEAKKDETEKATKE
ncbi:MAG TPA: DUF5606 domain-containing protein [Bacteroidales bacterium]|nr:DUF5606 domain-containing protein [Bacteroidales bacterium]